jgi:hypothetical protein
MYLNVSVLIHRLAVIPEIFQEQTQDFVSESVNKEELSGIAKLTNRAL